MSAEPVATRHATTAEDVAAETAETLEAMEWLVRELNKTLMGFPALDFDEQVTLLERTRIVREALATIEASMQRHAWKARGDRYGGQVEHPEFGTIDVRRGSTRVSWDNEGAAAAVVDAHMRATDGEVPDPDEVKRWLLEAGSFGYWRKGVLTDLGIDVEDYVTSSPGDGKITVPGRSKSQANPLLIETTSQPASDSPAEPLG